MKDPVFKPNYANYSLYWSSRDPSPPRGRGADRDKFNKKLN
jgi:hypothetical protein